MPNHCECDLRITGPSDDLAAFWAPVRLPSDPKDGGVCILEAHYPRPEIYDFESGSRAEDALVLFGTDPSLKDSYDEGSPVTKMFPRDSWREVAQRYVNRGQIQQFSRYATREEIAAKIHEATKNDKSWSGEPELPMPELAKRMEEGMRLYGAKDWYNWCVTCWGTKWGDYRHRDVVVSPTEGYIKLTFDSAWSPPIAGFSKIASDWPQLGFEMRYYEMGAGFKGRAAWNSGKLVKDESGKYRGNRGG